MKLIFTLTLCLLTVIFSGCTTASPSASPGAVPSPELSPSAEEPSPGTAENLSAVYDEVYDIMKDYLIAAGNSEDSFPEDRSSLPMYLVTHMKKGDEAFDSTMEALGFGNEAVEEFLQIQPMMNVNADNIIVIIASDTQAVKTSLEAYHQTQVDIWSSYLPLQYEKVEKNVQKELGSVLYYVTAEDELQPKLVNAIENTLQ